jgi:hypothetical protein
MFQTKILHNLNLQDNHIMIEIITMIVDIAMKIGITRDK